MRPSLSLVSACLLGLLVVSSAMIVIVPARAQVSFPYIGWDNAEFYVGGGSLSYVVAQADINQQLAWSSSPPKDQISLQYNPDEVYSAYYQSGGDWFQAGIATTTSSCAYFTVQVYVSGGPLVWDNFYPGTDENTCDIVNGILNSGAIWYMSESINTNGYISNVIFYLYANGGANYLYDNMFVPTTWVWIRSHAVWVGTDADTGSGIATFTSGSGEFYISSNLNLNVASPPQRRDTSETSNMEYGCFSGQGTTLLSQSFGLSGFC